MENIESDLSVSIAKNRKKPPLTVEDKKKIIKAYEFASKQSEINSSIEGIVRFTGDRTGVTASTVYNVLREYRTTGGQLAGPKPYKRMKAVLDNVNDRHKNIIREIIHSYFYNNKLPTVTKLIRNMNAHEDMPDLKLSSLRAILKDMNFRFVGKPPNSLLKEDNQTIKWRREYLNKIKQYREENRKLYYVGQMWIYGGKENKIVISHVGSDDGFVSNGLQVYIVNYKDNKGATRFEKWITSLLPMLEPNSVIVLDNDSSYLRKDEKPTDVTKMKSWLKANGISYSAEIGLKELLNLVQKSPEMYIAAKLVKRQSGRHVLVVPKYHSELNPIALIWAQIKYEINSRNTTFKLSDVTRLLQEAISNVSSNDWKDALEHVKDVEIDMERIDSLIEKQEKLLPINLKTGSTSDST